MLGIAIVNTKGGVGKTSLAHLLALGAAWRNTPAYLMHTDDRDPIKVNGRPYMYYDCRDPETLSRLIGAALNQDGLCIIDGSGSRPEFDVWIADSMDLVLIPVTPDPEAITVSLQHYDKLKAKGAKNVRFIKNQVSSNAMENKRDQEVYFSQLPEDLIIGQIGKVSAIKRLKESDTEVFKTPSTNINNLARRMYSIVTDACTQ